MAIEVYKDYKIKTIYSDFKVTETIKIDETPGSFHYYRLKKCGYKTSDVVSILSDKLMINKTDISYAGLKDEDAETIQYIAIKDLKLSHYSFFKDKNVKTCNYFTLEHIGSYLSPLQIGKLQGNHFKIRIRNLPIHIVHSIIELVSSKMLFLNYYGIQRFGMPNCPQYTHYIGENIINENYELALLYLFKSNNISISEYCYWKNNCKDFFFKLDLRELSFFVNAWDSYVWNIKIIRLVESLDLLSEMIYFDSIFFRFAKIRDYSSITDELITRHKIDKINDNFAVSTKSSHRAPIIGVEVSASEILLDDIYTNNYMIDVEFDLPTGSYATSIIDQILWIASTKQSNM